MGVPAARQGARWPAPTSAPAPAAATHDGTTGPGTGQRIPGRRARCPLVTPRPRSAGVNDRRRRCCSLRRRRGRPLSRHHIALSPSNTPRAPRLAAPRPRPHSAAPGLGAGPGIARPARPLVFVRRGSSAARPGLAPRPRTHAGPTRPPPGGGKRHRCAFVSVPQSALPREAGQGFELIRTRGGSALPHPLG